MNFQIKAFKHWQTEDGGGYQFNLYLDGKKFAWVHNDGNGGCIDMTFADSDSSWKESEFKTIWDAYVKSLGHWVSSIDKAFIDHDTDTAIGILVEDYEMAKSRKKGTLFRLKTDDERFGYRILNVKDLDVAIPWLTNKFGANQFEIV